MAEPIGRPNWPILTEQVQVDIAEHVQLKELRNHLSFDLVGWLFLVAATVYMGVEFSPFVSTGLLAAWLLLQAATLVGLSASLLQRLIRRSVVRATIQQIKAETAQAQLAIALTEVSDQRDARARFMASISHDLQQPLQAAQMLFELSCDPGETKSSGIAEDGRTAFASMRNLIEQMLEFMRLSAQRPAAAVRSVVTVDQAFEALRARYRLREGGGVRLRWLPCSVPICVNLDHFHRVIGNLVNNALRHAHARRILIGTRRHASSIDLWVIDDGVGIPSEFRSTLFDPYVRGLRPGGGEAGSGLGLASAKVLAEAMGASLTVGPASGRRVSFKLMLPMVGQDPTMSREDVPEQCYAA